MSAKELSHERVVRVGVISDTHGSLPSRVPEVFTGVDHIVHAGDYGSPEVLLELEAIAPLTYVWGNTDTDFVGDDRASVVLGGCRVVVTHDEIDLRTRPAGPDACLVITGHTHVPRIFMQGRALHVNPGSSSRPRKGYGPSVALVSIAGGIVDADIIYL